MFSSRPDINIDGRFLTELNLHRHFPILALAWIISGEQRYAKVLVEQLLDWIRENPPVSDPFISDGLELAARVACWTHCLYLLQDFPIDIQEYLEILNRIDVYGSLIYSQDNVSGSHNNHQIAEAFGLFYIGTMYPELKDADVWRDKGLALLTDNLNFQFLDGGVHAEQSVSYHLFVLECYLLTILLSQANNIDLSDQYYTTLDIAAEFLFCLQKPNGAIPMLGDAAFRFFCPTGNASYDAAALVAAVGAILNKSEYFNTRSNRLEEVFWLVGREKFGAYLKRDNITSSCGTKVFSDAGHIIVNTNKDNLSQYLYFKCGPQGLGRTAGHGHDDVLNIEYSALGDEFLVDPGTYTYSRINPLRRYFMGARAHNTVLVDGAGATQPSDGAFGWKKTVDGELIEVASTKDVVWMRGQHHGYATSQGGKLRVERALLLLQDCYVLVIDRVQGVGKHKIENLFHFHPDIDVRLEKHMVEAQGKYGRLTMLMESSAPASKSLHRGADDQQPGWYSGQYGELQPSSTVRVTSDTQLPFWRVTGLFPSLLDASKLPLPRLSTEYDYDMTVGNNILKIIIGFANMKHQVAIKWDDRSLYDEACIVGTMSLLRESATDQVMHICPNIKDPSVNDEKELWQANLLNWQFRNPRFR